MLLTTAAAIRQGVSIIELERRIEALQESQRQQLIAKGFISDDPDGLIEVDAAEDEAPAVDRADGPQASVPPSSGQAATETARQAA